MRFLDINWRSPHFKFSDISRYDICKPWPREDRDKLTDICRNREVPWPPADCQQLVSILRNLNCQEDMPKPRRG